jgi:hypothetical protein
MGNGFNPPVRKTPDLLRAAKTLCFGTQHCIPLGDLAGISLLTLRLQPLYRVGRSLSARVQPSRRGRYVSAGLKAAAPVSSLPKIAHFTRRIGLYDQPHHSKAHDRYLYRACSGAREVDQGHGDAVRLKKHAFWLECSAQTNENESFTDHRPGDHLGSCSPLLRVLAREKRRGPTARGED